MRVVQICPTPFPSLGGPAKNYAQFHAALNTETICFIRPSDGVGEIMVVPTKINIRTVDFPLLTHYYYTEPAELKMAELVIAEANCLIIHNFYRFPAAWGARVARKHNVPYIVVLHGILDPWVFNKNGILKRLWLNLYGYEILNFASGVLCATNRERSKAERYLKPDTGKVVPWAVEIPGSASRESRRAALRASLGIGDEDRVIIFFGRLDKMKRPIETLELAANMREPRLKLLVVGPDADVTSQQLIRKARRLKWDGLRVIGPCFGTEKFNYLGAADAYISLSHRENFNFTAAEAMMSGLPVILSEGNDLGWEFVGQGFSWQLHTQDANEARAALRSFLQTSPSTMADMGRAAAKWAAANLSTTQFKQKLTTVVEDCVINYQCGPTGR